MNAEKLVNIGRLSRLLNTDIRWLRKETTANRIPHLQAGKYTLYNIEAVKAVLAKRAAEPNRPSILAGGRK